MKWCSELKISIITAVYNNQKTIGQSIDSVLSQTYSDIEYIVIDGASTDGTMDVLRSFRPRLDVMISEPDSGIYEALNKGIKYATGDVIGFLHADDIFESNDVLMKVATAFQNQKIDAIYGDLVYVQQDDMSKVVRYWKSGQFHVAALHQGWMPPHPTFYVRRSVYERLGAFDTSYKISADFDAVLRFLAIGKIRVAYIPEVLVRMRTGGISNRSLKTIAMKSLEDFRALRKNKVGGSLTLLKKNLRKVGQFWHR